MAKQDCRTMVPRTSGDCEHFWSHMDKSGGPDSCWLWTGSKDKKGYGQWHIRRGNERGKFRAHRMAYFLAYGIDPGSLFVCHTCDQPACVNPKHLWCGTNTDNMRDCVSKGRKKWNANHTYRKNPELIDCGEKIWSARLTGADVIEVRRLRATGWLLRELAAKFGTSEAHISRIILRKTWKHIA